MVPSASVVPSNDPSLLFTSAGMVPFKNMFLGSEPLVHGSRVTTAQNCVRAGGKHNDLDNVGVTARHHTFFEMLGNFSFGDYFKEEAMYYAWKFLTEELKLPQSRLRISVFETDNESIELWTRITGWKNAEADGKIFRMGMADNFWKMGDSGPCGPCSEIYWDQLEPVDGERFLEIWNLVFMQYETQSKDGPLQPLAKPCVDTGMGLERIASVMQRASSNYGINTLNTFINRIDQLATEAAAKIGPSRSLKLSGSPNFSRTVALRVIADHMRASIHLINEGIIPSNTGRGYVLRRILRRATRFAALLGAAAQGIPFLNTLTRTAILEAGMLAQNQQLVQRIETIARVIEVEELAFLDTLARGYRVLDEEAPKVLIPPSAQTNGMPTLPGDLAFVLYDRYGFPIDLTEICAKERGWAVDTASFEQLIEQRKQDSRKGWVGSGDVKSTEEISHWRSRGIFPAFCGYHQLSVAARPIAATLVRATQTARANGDVWMTIDPSPFYAQGGGQVSDQGRVRLLQNGEPVTPWLQVVDVVKPYEGANILRLEVESQADESFDLADLVRLVESKDEKITVEAHVDQEHRRAVSAHHSATHLLHAALRNMLPAGAPGTANHGQPATAQAGSFVGPRGLRFDFTYPRPLTSDEIATVQDWVNAQVLKSVPVSATNMTLDEAMGLGAVALFGDKYQESSVRVVRFGNEMPVSTELCGGTHVSNSAECFPIVITKEVGVSSGVRRIEAVAGKAASTLLLERSAALSRIAELVRLERTADASEVEKRVIKQNERIETLNSQLKEANAKLRQSLMSAASAASAGSSSGSSSASMFSHPGWSCRDAPIRLPGPNGVPIPTRLVVHGVPELDGSNYAIFRDMADKIAMKKGNEPTLHVFIVENSARCVVINQDWAIKKSEKSGKLKDSEVQSETSAVALWKLIDTHIAPGSKGGGTFTVAQGSLNLPRSADSCSYSSLPEFVLNRLREAGIVQA